MEVTYSGLEIERVPDENVKTHEMGVGQEKRSDAGREGERVRGEHIAYFFLVHVESYPDPELRNTGYTVA